MDERTTLRYIDELQGQIDQLKKIIKGGGGGGSVVINPEGAATADLEKIKSGDTIYGLNYNKNANRPQVNGNLLTGNKNSKQLNIAESMTEVEYAALSSMNEHEVYFLQENASTVTETEDGFTIEWEAYSDPAYVATLSYTPSDQDVTGISSVTCDTDTIEIVTFELNHGTVSVTIGCEDPSGVPEAVEFTFTFTQPAGGTRIVKDGLDFGADTFTTIPIKVGKWIDGKDLYRVVLSANTALTQNAWNNDVFGIDSYGWDIVKFEGIAYNGGYAYCSYGYYRSSDEFLTGVLNDYAHRIDIFSKGLTGITAGTCVVYFTKSN